MGGRALNNYGVTTRRISTAEFYEIFAEIKNQLVLDLGLQFSVVKCYHQKETHGDLDLLLKIDHQFHNKGINLKKYIKDTFQPKAIHNNGGVYSFDYKDFQVDFIPIKESKWETALVYYSYDPLGNIMGKTYHKFGLSYGWDGLFYKFRNFHGRNSQNILLTEDPKAIFDFGGYDYDRYLNGFDTLEEIYGFAIAGKYFDSEMFKIENLNHVDRKRNRKRGSYHAFLNYLNDNKIDVSYPFSKDKTVYLTMIDKAFPEVKFIEKLEKLRKKDEENMILTEKFNGHLAMEWIPELKGKELGQVITKFKNYLGNGYSLFLRSATMEEIRFAFINVYNGTLK